MTTEKTNLQCGSAERLPSGRVDRDRCPLCGGPNGCAIEKGEPAVSCWCMRANIGEDVLASVPLPMREQTCICPACAAGDK